MHQKLQFVAEEEAVPLRIPHPAPTFEVFSLRHFQFYGISDVLMSSNPPFGPQQV